MRSRPKRMPNSSRPRRCSSARSALHAVTARPAPRAAARACRARRRRRPPAPWPRSPGWRASAPPARSRRRASARRSSIRRAAAPRSTASDGSTATDPPGTATVAAGSPSLRPRQPGQPRHVRGRALVALGLQPRRQHRGRRGADPVAPAAQLLHGGDRPRQLGLGLRVEQRSSAVGPAVAHQQAVRARQVRPQLLGHERDHGMGDGQRLGQHAERERADGLVVVGVQPRLDDLQVPVAQLAVDEVVEAERGAVELERLDRARRLGLGALQPREDPRVLDRLRAQRAVRDRDVRARRAAARAGTR